MPHGGVLAIRTELSKGSDPGWATAEIRDTGGGIPPELLHNIFNPFFTTKASGSGLGLSIVHKIVTRHEGNVEIDNRPGEGVSFLIKLPVLKGTPSPFRKFKFNGEESDEKNFNRR
jgi:signal transduction histidine kinase